MIRMQNSPFARFYFWHGNVNERLFDSPYFKYDGVSTDHYNLWIFAYYVNRRASEYLIGEISTRHIMPITITV